MGGVATHMVPGSGRIVRNNTCRTRVTLVTISAAGVPRCCVNSGGLSSYVLGVRYNDVKAFPVGNHVRLASRCKRGRVFSFRSRCAINTPATAVTGASVGIMCHKFSGGVRISIPNIPSRGLHVSTANTAVAGRNTM